MTLAARPRISLALALTLLCSCSAVGADSGSSGAARSAGAVASAQAAGDWTVYGSDPQHTRFSRLDLIDASNVAGLEVAWRWSTEGFGERPESRNAGTPLAAAGVVYVTAGQQRAVVALDGLTGERRWQWQMDEGERLDRAPRKNSGRGVAYWEGQATEPARVFAVTPGYHLVALDAASGVPVESFADGGVLDLMQGHRTREGIPMVGSTGASSPPLVAGDVLVVGSAHHVGMRPPSMVNTPGDVRGYDVRSGELLWTFKTIPDPGEVGHETWLEDSWSYTGNAAVWAPMSYDPETGYVYLPVEAATGDYYGGHRPGDNLFSTSLVCLDARTGERVWHFQLIHHDIWDWDTPTAPILADVNVDGAERKIVAQVTKQAFTYVFDRLTGEPIWPIEERPVPQTDVPGEWTAPTQPFPTRPAPFDRQGFSHDDLLDITPAVLAEAEEAVRDYRMGELYTPPSVDGASDGTRGTLSLPGSLGGANWEGAALDPTTGILYVGSATDPSLLSLVPGGEHSDMRYIAGGPGTPRLRPGVSIVNPPWGRITAIDLKSGDHVWMVPNGNTADGVAERLGVDPELLPRAGKPIRSGLLVTPTLLLAVEGFGGDPVLWAHDKATGRVITELQLPASGTGHPMTYSAGGHQFILLAVGAPGHSAEFVALTLP